MEEHHDFKPGDLVWFEPGVGFPLPGEVLEVHTAAQIIIIAASIDGKVSNKSMLTNNQSSSQRNFSLKLLPSERARATYAFGMTWRRKEWKI